MNRKLPYDVRAVDIPSFCPDCGDIVGVDDITFRAHIVFVEMGSARLFRVCAYHNGRETKDDRPSAVPLGFQRVNCDVNELLSTAR